MEIAEEEEEEERERKRQSIVKEEERPTTSGFPVKLDADLANSPEASRFTNDTEPPQFTGVPRPSSPAQSFDEAGRRMSSQTSRSDLYPTMSYPYSKPRVMIGPRPSTDTSGRPRSSAGGAAYRPVSTVPAGIKSSKSSKKGRSQSQAQDEEVSELQIKEEAEDFSFPVATTGSDNNPARPLTSNGDHAATTLAPKTNMSAAAAPPTKQNTMTPEKARLLKAMKLREKKLAMSAQQALDVPATDIPSEPSTPGLPDENLEPEIAETGAAAQETPEGSEEQQDDNSAPSKADSGIEVDVGADHTSVDSHADSHPTSPFTSSDVEGSTQASSLSDSTDETVLAKDSGQDEVDESNPTVPATQNEASPNEESAAEAEIESRDRTSDITVTPTEEKVVEKEEEPAVSEDDTNAKAISDEPTQSTVSDVAGASTSSAVSPLPSAPEQEAAIVAASEAPAQPSPDDATEPKAPTPVEGENASSPIRVPVSKFSTQDLKSLASTATQDIPAIVTQASDADSQEVAPPVPEKDADAEVPKAAGSAAAELLPSRRKAPEPIRTDMDTLADKRRSILSITENDGLMEELQSATVQQATPITVSKSPISPFFSVDQTSKRAPGGSEAAPRFLRTVSNPVRNSFLAPGEASTAPVRSASSGTTYLQRLSQQQAAVDVRPKSTSTAKLGSSISQRIKALEKLSGTPPGAADAASPKERPATTFFAVRKAASTRENSRPASVIDRASSLSRGASPSPPASMDGSPETRRVPGRDRSGSVVNRLSMFEGGMLPRGRPESVQVTARIVRDPNQPFPKRPESKEYGPLDLKQSPLLVDVKNQRMPSQSPVRAHSSLSMRTNEQEMPPPSRQTLRERRLSKEPGALPQDSVGAGEVQTGGDGPRPRRRSSLSFVKDFIKDRTESIIGAKSPSTDNLSGFASPAPTTLVSPAMSSSRPPSVQQGVSLTRRLSVSSRRSSIDRNSPGTSVNTAAILAASRTGDATADSESDVKSIGSSPASPGGKSSRTSRFIRRLSNTLTTGRKNTAPSISPTVAEENAAEVEAASRGSTATSAATQAQPTIVAFMGDVNVQFPDNLLWKRRSICLDSQGFLILSAVSCTPMLPSGKDKHGALMKRYHMSDFKAPFAPDVELQELPNSVVLDLIDGSGLQIACEDRAGQMSILHSKFFSDGGLQQERKLTVYTVLQDAHHNHANFGR